MGANAHIAAVLFTLRRASMILLTLHPELAAEWSDRNGTLDAGCDQRAISKERVVAVLAPAGMSGERL
jgi:hypothetical protein